MKKFILTLSLTIIIICANAQSTLAQSVTEIAEEVGRSVIMIVVYDVTGSMAGQGSGVFITDDGSILTNAHVLKNAYSAEVISNLGTFERVTILFKDENRDLALIKVATIETTPAVFSGETDFKPGQRVIAIGNPLGLEKTVSDGLISGIRKTRGGVELIQTTVPISPGSSGGVLLNGLGEVIGITTSTVGEGQNINFAISLNTILTFFSDYKKTGLQGMKFQLLKPAKESLWYRVILKWVGKILLLLIALFFGSAFYYVIPLVILACVIVYYIILGLWRLVSYPFRKMKERKYAYQAHVPSLPTQTSLSQSSLFENELDHEDEELAGSERGPNNSVFFYCWKCGSKFTLTESMKGKTIECHSCHAQLTIPIE